MKQNFMWYYTTIWLIIGGLSCFLDWFNYGDEYGFWGFIIVIPTVVWLIKSSK